MTPLAAIHVAKKQLGLDDDTYRDMLERVTGKRSAKDMTPAEQTAVVQELRGKGFEPASKGARRRLSGPFAGKLQALWIAGWNLGLVRDRDDAALLAFVKRQTGMDHVRFLLDAEDAARAIEALKGWLARDGGVHWGDRATAPQWLRPPGAKIAVAQWTVLANAGEVTTSFEEFKAFVADRAFRALGQMSPAEWRGIMNTLGERVRRVKR